MIAPVLIAAVVAVIANQATRPAVRRPTRAATTHATDRSSDQTSPHTRPLSTSLSAPWRTSILIAVAALSTLVLGPLLVGAAVVAIVSLPRLRLVLARKQDRRRVEAALPDAIEMLVLVIHAGMTPHQAILLLEARAPLLIRPAFADVHHRTSRGTPLADALAALPERLGPGALPVADTLAMAERYGTPIATALAQLSHDVRERRRRATEAAARQLPIRMSFPLVACTLPSFVLLAIVPAVLAALESLDATGF